MHPLPRSLAALSGESLVSYLLRLGHRLGVSPLHLIRAAGWIKQANPNHFPGSLLLDLPKPQAEALARLTEQTAREVSALTLTQWRDRYPPIARSMPGPGRLMRPDAWLYVGSPRFCPSCLAGDGTPAQQLHGGPWLKLWHLPVVFACAKHRIYLEAGCPHCGQPHDTQGPLIQRANDHTLHPAQCRWTVDAQTQRRKSYACAGRLDHRNALARGDRPQPTADILRFQQYLRGRLKSPTRTTDASEYFTDLRLATALISTTWPHGRHLLDADTAERIDSSSHQLHGGPGGKRNQQARDTPPRDPIACGALLMAADRLLRRDDLPDLLSDLTRAAFGNPSGRTPWAVLYDKHKNDCSERLRQAAEHATRAFPRVDGRGGTRAPLKSVYQAEHIPAFLEPDWYQRHLANCAGSETKAVRRAAAVRLVQWAMGGSYDNAAKFLGITPVQTHLLTGRETRRSVRRGCNPLELDRALRALASELQSPRQPPVDYRHRRQALHEWVLSVDAWSALVRELPPTLLQFRTLSDDRKRQDASVFIWTLVTRGEHLYAPRPLEAAQPTEIQRQWAVRRNTTWFQFSRPDPMRHYADLRQALARYAHQLARDIDSGAGPGPTIEDKAGRIIQPPDAHAQ
ncbi:TniQ family protein [Streptomyces sp. NPDC005065]|uniref:TniQ family protein n=1 Tax=Streptomyces sp. NPDC005065 TaxID=3154461 RepID=UPI0033A93944